MARYEDFSVGLLRTGSSSPAAVGSATGVSAASNGNANGSSLIYVYLAPGALAANIETLVTSAIQGLKAGDSAIFTPAGAAPSIAGAVITRAYCAVDGILTVGFLSGAITTPATGMYRFSLIKPN